MLKLSLGLKKSPKTRARVLFDTSARFILENVDAAQLQALSVPTLDSYKKWAKEAKQDPIVDELGSDARLFWVGSKTAKRMILYCHGEFVGGSKPPGLRLRPPYFRWRVCWATIGFPSRVLASDPAISRRGDQRRTAYNRRPPVL